MDERELLKEFLEETKVKGGRKQYLIALRKRMPKLFTYLNEQDLRLQEVKVKDAQSYQGWLIESRTKEGNKYSHATVRAYLFGALAFYNFLKQKGIVHTNPFKEIRKVRAGIKLPRNLLKEKEMSAFLERISQFDLSKRLTNQVRKYKVHVIAELLYSTGLRIEEVANLKTSDIDLPRSIVEVREGKGGYSRIAFMNEFCREVLRIYLDRMRPLVSNSWNEKNGDNLFGVSWGQLGHMVNANLHEITTEMKLPKQTCHSFRHALGYHLLRAGCNIRYIQQLLGHKKLKNTEIYTKVEKEDLKAVMDKHHPRRWGRIANEATHD